MSSTDLNCIYNKEHMVPVYERGRMVEERKLTITVCDMKDRDVLVIKVRDPDDFSFNFVENIDSGDFEVMRNNQNLDINFSEFKINLIDMLQQHQRQEMYLKIDCIDAKCTLIFYGKSKIKFVIYLTIDLKLTNQKEIFLEMNNNLKLLQDVNDRLKWQVNTMKKHLVDKENEISNISLDQNKLISGFFGQVSNIENVFNRRASEIASTLSQKLDELPEKLAKLSLQLKQIKTDNELKSSSSQRLLKTMENLREETIDNASLINELKKQNSVLMLSQSNHEKAVTDLNDTVQDLSKINSDLQDKNEELRQDLEKLSVIIAQKKETNDELARDVVKANQMLVNFNIHYDKKVNKIEELKNALLSKEQFIEEQATKITEILKDFDQYKSAFNPDEFEKLKKEITFQANKIHELESNIRKANKMNTILTQKVSGAMGFGS